MAFNLNAFSGGLGGLLQQMMAGQQQSQAMQQKMVDQEIPLFNQQRAYQKESTDQAYEALKRKNDLEMMPLLAQLQRGQIQGQDIANRTGTANLGIKRYCSGIKCCARFNKSSHTKHRRRWRKR